MWELSETKNSKSTPELALLRSVKNNRIEEIKKLIREKKALLEHEYKYAGRTILAEACMEEGVEAETVETLLKLGANVEGNTNGIPLHIAAANPDSSILKVIIEHLKPGQINNVDSGGRTALHYLITGYSIRKNEEKFCSNVKLLLKNNIDINQGDAKNVSAIFWAAYYGYKNVVKTILDANLQLDLDSHTLDGKSARDLIVKKDLYDKPLPAPFYVSLSPKDQLFMLVKSEEKEEREFINYFSNLSDKDPVNINADDGCATFLQYSCAKGRAKIAEYLINKSATVDKITTKKQETPLVIAARHGYFEILEMLLNKLTSEQAVTVNILCEVIKNSNRQKLPKVDYERCCEKMLDKLEKSENKEFVSSVVTGADALSNTPIRYALNFASETVTQRLFRLGASLAYKNKYGFMPFEDFGTEWMERYLDLLIDRVKPEGLHPKVKFNCQSLILPKKVKRGDPEASSDDIVAESELFVHMSKNPKFRRLLRHPVIVSILLMKWQQIRLLFYIDFIFYILFVIFLMFYIFTNNYIKTDSSLCTIVGQIFLIALSVTFWLLVIRETFQLVISPRKYFLNFENILEFCIVILTGVILYIDSSDDSVKKPLISVVILLAAYDLILMIGRFSRFSMYVAMMKTVSENFLKLLLYYALLILGIALSFYILSAKTESSQSGNNSNNTDSENFDFGLSLFKVMIMLSGQVDSEVEAPDVYHVATEFIYFLFVFMMTIVLMNLLNGLAVSDTQAIKHDAELVGYIARARHINSVEHVLLGNIGNFPLIGDISSRFFRRLSKKISVFRQNNFELLVDLENGKIEIDEEGKSRSDFSFACFTVSNDPYLSENVLERIHSILGKRNLADASVNDRLKQLQDEINEIKTILHEMKNNSHVQS